jgi:hypothetical protein
MTQSAIDHLVSCQDALMRAIDARNVTAMDAASAQVAKAAREVQAAPLCREDLDKLQHALNQTTALKMRVNTMTDWTCQRIDRLAELRGQTAPPTYGKCRKTGNFSAIG